MKKLLWIGFCAGLVFPVCAQEVKPKAAAEEAKPAAVAEAVKPAAAKGKELNADAGADLRIRQEVLLNMPERNGAFMPNQNYIRYRPRVWGQLNNEDFKLYMRVTDEMRSYTEPNVPNYRWPD